MCENHGKTPFKTHLENAAKIAEEGFIISKSFSKRIQASEDKLRKYSSSSEIFLNKDGTAKTEGSLLKQIDLAKTYRGIANNGTDWFYKGPFARATTKWMKKNGGILNENDFEKFFITTPKPIKSTYKNYTIIGM